MWSCAEVPTPRNAKVGTTHCLDVSPLRGDQFQDVAGTVVNYVHFASGVLPERRDRAIGSEKVGASKGVRRRFCQAEYSAGEIAEDVLVGQVGDGGALVDVSADNGDANRVIVFVNRRDLVAGIAARG